MKIFRLKRKKCKHVQNDGKYFHANSEIEGSTPIHAETQKYLSMQTLKFIMIY